MLIHGDEEEISVDQGGTCNDRLYDIFREIARFRNVNVLTSVSVLLLYYLSVMFTGV